MTPSQIDAVLAQIREYLETPNAIVESTVDAGSEARENWNTGLMERADNGTRTLMLTIRVKDGARDTVGPPIGAPEGWPGT